MYRLCSIYTYSFVLLSAYWSNLGGQVWWQRSIQTHVFQVDKSFQFGKLRSGVVESRLKKPCLFGAFAFLSEATPLCINIQGNPSYPRSNLTYAYFSKGWFNHQPGINYQLSKFLSFKHSHQYCNCCNFNQRGLAGLLAYPRRLVPPLPRAVARTRAPQPVAFWARLRRPWQPTTSRDPGGV